MVLTVSLCGFIAVRKSQVTQATTADKASIMITLKSLNSVKISPGRICF
jgi:hypothetical protein